jgi:predicted transcriptional regulator
MQTTSEQPQKVKFATQADPELLAALRKIAGEEGRQLQSLVDEALREYVERKQGTAPRKHVMQALQAGIVQFDSLYRELSK